MRGGLLIVSSKYLVEAWNKKEGTNRGIVLIADQVLRDLETVEKLFRLRVLNLLERAVEKGEAVQYEELIWETRLLRRRAGKALGGK